MSRRASFVLPSMITALAASSCVFTLPASTAFAAACTAAPKSPAPQGSHWYYRTDRALGRKCWYLAEEGHPIQAAGRRAAPQTRSRTVPPAEPDAESAAPSMTAAAARLTEPLRSPPPPVPPAADWTIAQATPRAPLAAPSESAPRNDEPASTLTPDASASIAQVPVMNAAQPPAMNTAQEPAAADQPPAPLAASDPSATAAPTATTAEAPATGRTNMLQFVFVAFAGLCFLGGIFFYFVSRRRSMEVSIIDLNTTASVRRPLVESTADAPSHQAPSLDASSFDAPNLDAPRLDAPSLDAPSLDAPSLDAPSLAPDAGGRRNDSEVDERLRRFSQAWKRQAA